jgi:hypothetical protein
MDDPNAIIGVIVPIVTPTLFIAPGHVEVASLWSQLRPILHPWRARRPPRIFSWKTTHLPDAHSGGF